MATVNIPATLLRRFLGRSANAPIRFASSKSTTTTSPADDHLDIDALDASESATQTAVLMHDEDSEQREHELQLSRNKSRLLPQHRNMLNDTKPYDEAQSWIHKTVKYNRMQFGRYGLASGIDPRVCYPTPQERATSAEYDRVAHPLTIQEMIKISRAEALAKRQVTIEREATIHKKLGKLEQWTKELNAKVAKKEADARAARERKDRLVEEVRRQFGFKVDARDERFQELLAQKEKEDKKKQKEAKRKQKDDRMLAKLQETQAPPLPAEAPAGNKDVPAAWATDGELTIRQALQIYN